VDFTPDHFQALRATAARMRQLTSSPADVADYVQSAALAMVEGEVRGPLPHLTRRAQCAALDAARKDLTARGWRRNQGWAARASSSGEVLDLDTPESLMSAAEGSRTVDSLTPMARQVAACLLLGERGVEIARRLGVSEATVSTLKQQIRGALAP